MTYIYIIRHAEAEGNLYRRVHGHYNSLITPRGKEQIRRLQERFRDIAIDAVYSSDLHRARETASAIYAPKGLPLIPVKGLREVAMGVWEDVPWGHVEYTEPDQLYAFNNDPLRWKVEGAEPFDHLQRRLSGAIAQIAAENRGRTVAVVTHGMALRAFAARVMGIEPGEIARVPHSDNTSVSLLKVGDGGEMEFEYYGDNAHIPEELSTFARQKWWREATTFDSSNMRFEPLNLDTQMDLYLDWRRAAWSIECGDKAPPLRAWEEGVRRNSRRHPWAVSVSYLGGEPVGVVELDIERDQAEKAGVIEFIYVTPDVRKTGKGAQLLGQAVSVCRSLGREKLRMRVGCENALAQDWCLSSGFCPVRFEDDQTRRVFEMDIAVPGDGHDTV